MLKRKKVKVNTGNTANLTMTFGDAALDSFQALMKRMQANPENFMVGSDLSMFQTGYMCTACAGPASRPGVSRCCSAPTIAVQLD